MQEGMGDFGAIELKQKLSEHASKRVGELNPNYGNKGELNPIFGTKRDLSLKQIFQFSGKMEFAPEPTKPTK